MKKVKNIDFLRDREKQRFITIKNNNHVISFYLLFYRNLGIQIYIF